MMRQRIENGFAALGRASAHHPWWIIFLTLALTALLASALPPRFDTTMEGFLRENSQAVRTYNQLRADFGRDEMMVATITTEDVFAPAFIRRLQTLEQDAWHSVPWMDDIITLTNVRAIYAQGEEIRIEGLFENWPDNAALEAIAERARAHDLYRRLVLSEDGTTTAVLVRLQNSYRDPDSERLINLGEREFAQAAEGMAALLQPFIDAGDEVAVAGTPVVITRLQQAMQQDMARFTLLTVVFVAVMLWWLFRRFTAVWLPVAVVLLAALGTLGLLAWTDTPLQMPLVILPSFLIAVGIGDSIHLLTIFVQQLRHQASVEAAIVAAMRYTGLAMLLTSLTTAAGLLSFTGSDILPLSSLGWVAASGVMLAWIYSITLLPACLALTGCFWPLGAAAPVPRAHGLMKGFTDLCIHLATRHARAVVVVALILTMLGFWQASGLRFSHHPLGWLPPDWSIRTATAHIDSQLSGSMNVELLLDTGELDGWRDLDRIQALARLHDVLAQNEFSVEVRKIQSLADMLREINQALHGGRADTYALPEDDALLAQELFLLELSAATDLYRRVDRDYRSTRITLSVPWVDTLHYAALVKEIENVARAEMADDIRITVTGIVPILATTLAAVIVDTGRSYLIAFAVIGLMMMVLLGSWRVGLLAMFPNLLPIVLALGFMHGTGIPLDMFSMLVGAIAIGLAVDDTVHFMHHYRRHRHAGLPPPQAIAETLHETGRAMLTTSVILAGGFLVFVLSELNNLTGFGLVTAFTITVALLADFLLAPALMLLFEPATRARNQ